MPWSAIDEPHAFGLEAHEGRFPPLQHDVETAEIGLCEVGQWPFGVEMSTAHSGTPSYWMRCERDMNAEWRARVHR